jgi:trans-aconitate methyltransferase
MLAGAAELLGALCVHNFPAGRLSTRGGPLGIKDNLFAQVARSVGSVDGWIQAHSPAHQRRNQWCASILDARAGMSILEIGCGPGLRLEALAARSPATLVGLDESEPLLRAAAKRVSGGNGPTRVLLKRGGVQSLRDLSVSFDRVLVVDAVSTWTSLDESVERIVASMASNAQLAICLVAQSDSDSLVVRIKDVFTRAGLAATRTRTFFGTPEATLAILGLKL